MPPRRTQARKVSADGNVGSILSQRHRAIRRHRPGRGLGRGSRCRIGPIWLEDYRAPNRREQRIVWDENGLNNQGDIATGIAARPTGGFLLVGTGPSIAFDDAGNPDWQYRFPVVDGRVVPSSNGGFGMLGGNGLVEIDAAGTPLWAKNFAALPSSYMRFTSLVSTVDGGFVAVGGDTVFGNPTENSRLLAVKVDAGGDFVGCLDVEKSNVLIALATSLSEAAVSRASLVPLGRIRTVARLTAGGALLGLALVPIVFLTLWAVFTGTFRDIERPQVRMLELDREIERGGELRG
jgi:hypothetical protein